MPRTQLKIKANDVRSIVANYKKGMGLVALSENFGISVPVIRRTLIENDVTIRSRGRPAVAVVG